MAKRQQASSQHLPSNIFQALTQSIVTNPIPYSAIVCLFAVTSMIDDPDQKNQTRYAVGIYALMVVVYSLHQWKLLLNESDNSEKNSGSSTKTKTTTTTTTKIKNIWEAGKSLGSTKKDKLYDEKPFGSKYYYAHNDPKTTGGYKDGLRMEDYRMNGPRLLSRNGTSVGEEEKEDDTIADQATVDDDDNDSPQEDETKSKHNTVLTPDTDVKNITKYLWDDPGDTGIATIRIDVLPDKRPGEYIDIKDVKLDEVQASLAGEGLLVKITVAGRGKFQLKISRLYGDAAHVKVIQKPKRLLVKIQKKKNSFLSSTTTSKSNLDAWPQPHRSI